MRVVFSECPPNYNAYLSPYQIWGFPEEGESVATALALGMLPGNREMTRFYLARSIRITISRYAETTAVRRVRKRCAHLRHRLDARAEVDVSGPLTDMCLRYMNESRAWATRRGTGLSVADLLARLDSPTATHLLTVTDPATGLPAGLVMLHLEPPAGFYAMAWLDEAYRSVYLGKYLKILAIEEAARAGLTHLYVGTCYSEGALYKTEFPGMEFFDGTGWSDDRHRLRLLLREQDRLADRHLFEHPAFLAESPPPGPGDAQLRLSPAAAAGPPGADDQKHHS